LDESLRGGLNTFRIHGQIYHRIGSVLPEVGKGPQYNQIWVYDVEEQNKYRNRFMSKLDLDISTKLQMALLECNPFAKLFKSHKYNMERQNDFNLNMVIKEKPENDQRVYNAPTASEVAAILPGDGSYDFSCRDIIISGRDGNIHRISELNGSYDPLHYVLFFPNGDAGFHLDIKFRNPTAVRKNMTPSDFYKYRLVTRRVSNNLIHYGQRLFQQYLAKIDMLK